MNVGINYEPVTITRQSAAVGVFQVKVLLKDQRSHGHVSPTLDRGEKWPFLMFQNIAAPVLVGDLVETVDGSLFKIYDVRRYFRTLQVDLQRVPYVSCAMWIPPALSAGVTGDPYRAGQPIYAQSADILAFIEPLGESQKSVVAAALGSVSVKTATAFALAPVVMESCIVYRYDSLGSWVTEYWSAIEDSSHFPVTNDYRVTVKRLLEAPPGVTI